jgi:hypothetical protein
VPSACCLCGPGTPIHRPLIGLAGTPTKVIRPPWQEHGRHLGFLVIRDCGLVRPPVDEHDPVRLLWPHTSGC